MRGELRIETESTSKMIVNKSSIDLPFGVNPTLCFSVLGEERKKCYPLVENNLLAHLQVHVRRDWKLLSAIERARVAKPGCNMDQGRSFMMKNNLGVPSLRYKLSHHSIVVILPNLNQYDQTQHSPQWDHVPHVRDFVTLSHRYALLSCEVGIFRVNKVRSGPSDDQALSKMQAH